MIRPMPTPPTLHRVCFFAVSAALLASQLGHAQVVVQPRSIVDSIANKIRADADFLRAMGEASVDFAEARKIRAEAYDKELDNVYKYAETYWKRRDLYEAEKLERYISPEVRRRLRDTKTWQRLKDHPHLYGPSIVNGKALNFLLARLSGTLLAYHYELTTLNRSLLDQLMLDDETLHKLRLIQDSPGGRRLVFRADEGVSLDLNWWPFALRDDALARQRAAFSEAREAVASKARSDKIIDETALRELMRALDRLDLAFREQYPKSRRLRSAESFSQYLTAERFLQSLAGEIHQIKETADARVFDGSLKFDHDDLVALLSHMSRNGLHFAPAQPGDEAAYHRVFRMMRDLYVTVADDAVAEDDEGLEGPARTQ